MTILILILCAIPAILVALFTYYVLTAALERSGVSGDVVLGATQFTFFGSLVFGLIGAGLAAMSQADPLPAAIKMFLIVQVLVGAIGLFVSIADYGARGVGLWLISWINVLCIYSPFAIIVFLMSNPPGSS